MAARLPQIAARDTTPAREAAAENEMVHRSRGQTSSCGG